MSFLHIDMAHVVEIISSVRKRTDLFYFVIIMGADALATQRARISATMILTMLNRIKSAPHVKG